LNGFYFSTRVSLALYLFLWAFCYKKIKEMCMRWHVKERNRFWIPPKNYGSLSGKTTYHGTGRIRIQNCGFISVVDPDPDPVGYVTTRILLALLDSDQYRLLYTDTDEVPGSFRTDHNKKIEYFYVLLKNIFSLSANVSSSLKEFLR